MNKYFINSKYKQMNNITRLIWLIAAIILLSQLISSGQNDSILADKNKEMHHETLGDKYLPNAYNNKKVSPGYRYKSTDALKTGSTSISTVQVNVDTNGQNIIGDAANEPNIAINPLNGNIFVIGWRQFDNVSSNFRQAGWSYSTDAGQTWTFPGTIQQGVFRSDPVLDFDAAGNFYYNSLSYDSIGNFECWVFKSTNGGVIWDTGSYANGGDKQWMTIDRTTGIGSGNIYSFWTYIYSSCLPGFFTRSTDGGSSFESCTPIDGYPYWGTMAVGNTGELYTCGAMNNSDSLVVVKSLNVQIPASVISWYLPVLVFLDGHIRCNATVNPAGLIGQANIDVDRSNGSGQDNVYLLASVHRISNNDPGDVMFASSTDGGLTWSSPIRINDDTSATNTQWFGTMSVAPNGRIDAIWLDTRGALTNSDSSALYYSYSTDQGNTWSVNEKLSGTFDPHVGYPNQNKMGDYFDMISENSCVHLAWANTLNGEEDVYYSCIIPPVATGINSNPDRTEFSIYPNPTTGVFYISSGRKQYHIDIFTLFGEKVYSKTISKTISEIDISSQPAGIYFLKIFNWDGSSVVSKIFRK